MVIFLTLALWSRVGVAGLPNCKDMDERTYEKLLPRVIEFFAKSNRFPLSKIDMSPGLDCGRKLDFYFEAKPEYNIPGFHWIIEVDKRYGSMSIIDGI